MKATIEEVAMLLGQKDIEIFCLQRHVQALAEANSDLQKRIEELTPKPDQAQP